MTLMLLRTSPPFACQPRMSAPSDNRYRSRALLGTSRSWFRSSNMFWSYVTRVDEHAPDEECKQLRCPCPTNGEVPDRRSTVGTALLQY